MPLVISPYAQRIKLGGPGAVKAPGKRSSRQIAHPLVRSSSRMPPPPPPLDDDDDMVPPPPPPDFGSPPPPPPSSEELLEMLPPPDLPPPDFPHPGKKPPRLFLHMIMAVVAHNGILLVQTMKWSGHRAFPCRACRSSSRRQPRPPHRRRMHQSQQLLHPLPQPPSHHQSYATTVSLKSQWTSRNAEEEASILLHRRQLWRQRQHPCLCLYLYLYLYPHLSLLQYRHQSSQQL